MLNMQYVPNKCPFVKPFISLRPEENVQALEGKGGRQQVLHKSSVLVQMQPNANHCWGHSKGFLNMLPMDALY